VSNSVITRRVFHEVANFLIGSCFYLALGVSIYVWSKGNNPDFLGDLYFYIYLILWPIILIWWTIGYVLASLVGVGLICLIVFLWIDNR
jgi:hypothetical protein